jgi:hypothetical protein
MIPPALRRRGLAALLLAPWLWGAQAANPTDGLLFSARDTKTGAYGIYYARSAEIGSSGYTGHGAASDVKEVASARAFGEIKDVEVYDRWGQTVLFCDEDDLYKVDAGTGAVTTLLMGLRGCASLSADRTRGIVYVAEGQAGMVTSVSIDGKGKADIIAAPGVTDIEFTESSGQLYVTDTSGIRSVRVSDGTVATVVEADEVPFDMVVDEDDAKLYYIGSSGLMVHDLLLGTSTHLRYLNQAQRVTLDGTQKVLYLSTGLNDHVYKVDSDSSVVVASVLSAGDFSLDSLGDLQINACALTQRPTTSPTPSPTANPTATPTSSPTGTPTGSPTAYPTATPTSQPTVTVTEAPTPNPTSTPTGAPSGYPTPVPTAVPTSTPTSFPTGEPTRESPMIATARPFFDTKKR